MDGADLLRVIAVLAVLYSHISFYLLDDIGGGWWMIDVVNTVLIEDAGLNLHLSFVGVSIFMLLTGLLITRSAMRQSRRDFMVARLARLVPALWFAIAMAVILVKLGLNGMFSGQPGITNGEAVLSFFLGGFFLRPEVAVLGVTWTLVVQIVFYLYCISMRGTLNTRPILVPLVGAALCALVIVYNLYLPQPYTVPFLTKVAGVLPTLFLGQIAYLGWARLITWRWVVVGVIAQIEVIRLAIEVHTFWMGDTYLWTLLVVTGTVLILAHPKLRDLPDPHPRALPDLRNRRTAPGPQRRRPGIPGRYRRTRRNHVPMDRTARCTTHQRPIRSLTRPIRHLTDPPGYSM
jgi:peptidoglycan/LPS O-acetylase OafA/YrhL